MHWSCQIPNIDFDPGDGHPIVLRINCLNSVDTSTALEIAFAWYRLVCSNGMMFGIKDSRLRKRHIQSLDPEYIAAYLREQLDQVPVDQSMYVRWREQVVEDSALVGWIDEKVSEEWGQQAAARVWNIQKQGCDGEVEQVRNLKPHQLAIRSAKSVPGAFAPTRNLFDVSQSLSWIAGTRNTIAERLEYIKAIPRLMAPLQRTATPNPEYS